METAIGKIQQHCSKSLIIIVFFTNPHGWSSPKKIIFDLPNRKFTKTIFEIVAVGSIISFRIFFYIAL